MRVGIGYDVHAFAKDRELWLGGVEIKHHQGLLGHSDADVLLHAIMDALLGAAGLRDIGYYFPDTDEQYKGASSLALLSRVEKLISAEGYRIGNIDAVIMAQAPRINPHIPTMKHYIAQTLSVQESQIGIKATTTEHLGFVGREEGIAAQAVVLLRRQ